MRRTALLLVGAAIVAVVLLWPRDAAGPADATAAPGPNGSHAAADAAPVGGPGGEPAGGSAEDRPQRATASSAEPEPSPEDVKGDRVVVRVRSTIGAELRGEVGFVLEDGRKETVPLVNGEAAFEVWATPLRAVQAMAHHHVWITKVLPKGSPTPTTVDLVVPAAGTLRIRLLDQTGRLLACRTVQSHAEKVAPGTIPPGDGTTGYSRRPWAYTDATGVAVIDGAMPGTHRVTVFAHAQWEEARSEPVEVVVGQTSEVTITAPAKDTSTYAGASFPNGAIPDLEFASATVRNYGLFYGDRGEFVFMFRDDGDRVVAIVPGESGAEITAFLAQFDKRRQDRPGSKRSEPFRLTVGATLPIDPVWKR